MSDSLSYSLLYDRLAPALRDLTTLALVLAVRKSALVR
jgi:hypothetical protein